MNDDEFNALLNGALHGASPIFTHARISLALPYLLLKAGEPAEQALREIAAQLSTLNAAEMVELQIEG
jgi:hypothetical protein